MSRTLAAVATAAGDLLVEIEGDDTVAVTGASFDSDRVASGDLFFCVPGSRNDGHDFAPAAISAGARALCVERVLDVSVPQIVVRDVRAAMPLLAAEALGRPAEALTILGVTGTNGKTTTAFLMESILKASGAKTGLIGTIETRIGNERQPGVRTTPESVDLQNLFLEMTRSGVKAVAMEVTSHALALRRVDGIRYACAAFTNLSQDHLDFHRDMDDYFAAKAMLFTPERCDRAAINSDDAAGRRLLEQTSVEVLSFGLGDTARVRATEVQLGNAGSTFELISPAGSVQVRTHLVGPFNISNCLAAAASAIQVGIDVGDIATGIEALRAVPGRFEAVVAGQPFSVVVDYAHTPDSLENALIAARDLAKESGGRVICTFGCGGDRDRSKRPLMGDAVARLADVMVVTSDNPRSEDPKAIIDDILEGVRKIRPEGPDATLVDRREAIAEVLGLARPGDVVVIAGKGHETGQEFSDRTIPFDDRDVAREGLERLGYRGDVER